MLYLDLQCHNQGRKYIGHTLISELELEIGGQRVLTSTGVTGFKPGKN